VREREGSEGAAHLINAVFTLLVLTLTAIAGLCALLLVLFPPEAAEGIANVEKLGLILGLLEVMVPYVVLVCVTAFLGAILQTLGLFAAPAAAPLILNGTWIAALFLLCPLFGTAPGEQIFGLALAVLIGGVLQMLVCFVPLWRRGVRVRPTLRVAHPAIARMLRLMLPILVGLAPTQINILADRLIAEALVPGNGANSALYFGTRVMQFPLALIGVAMGTAMLPALASHIVKGDAAATRRTLRDALSFTLFLAVPAAVGLMVLALPIVRFLFEHGRFGADDTEATRRVLLAYAAGIPVICAVQVATRAFYALGDSRTPVRAAMIAMAANLALNLLLVGWLEESGLALATTLAAAVNLVLLARVLGPRVEGLLSRGFGRAAVRVVALALVMGALCFIGYSGLDRALPPGTAADAVRALVPVFAGAGIYLGLARLAGSPELPWLRAFLARRRPAGIPEKDDR